MYKYNDGLYPAGRRPRLYLAKGGHVEKFSGKNIPGVVAIATTQYEQNGKWSNTTFGLTLAPGVRPLYFLSPMHGVWGDDLASWGEVAEKLALPVEECQRIVHAEYPRTAKRLDALEQFASEAQAEVEVVVVSFGSPTNRQRAGGYWEAPKSTQTADGRTVTVKPGDGGWDNPVVVEPAGARVISSRHSPGMHGGYRAIEVAVPLASAEPADPAQTAEPETDIARKLREVGL